MPLPKRIHLTRLGRIFRLPVGEIYLITINCADRRPILADAACARIVIETFTEYATRHRYGVLLYTVMPDHLHAVVVASDAGSGLSKFINHWKTWCTHKLREAGVAGNIWQKEFFDHRIRSETSLGEKSEYVAHNPVRAGLAKRPEDWPHTGGEWWEAYLARGADT